MIGKLTMENYILKKRERIPTTEETRGFIYHYRSLFESKKEGCRLMDIKRSTIKKEIEDISREHPYYGYRRITAQ